MRVRQEETTPIGNYFHDCGVTVLFNTLKNNVDEFEVETDELNLWIDNIISNLKGLKTQIKKCETEEIKRLQQLQLQDLLHKD